ncbi:unnamed protein product [Protopolystoma xenopodis]|uniref:Uncharacterized protein n=1 Tax=Protopolystoma xenopodis TaxID=117903 RepID=A0A3S5BDP8_9PLAT|nr:unnamed protein product [Protopolystoma xenopodis]
MSLRPSPIVLCLQLPPVSGRLFFSAPLNSTSIQVLRSFYGPSSQAETAVCCHKDPFRGSCCCCCW